MGADRPLKIGLSACFFHADPKRAIFKGKTLIYLEQSMAHWLLRAGVYAYMIPSVPEGVAAGRTPSLGELAGEMDALVLQGGSDVSPKSYGEEPLRPEWAGDYVRDCYEIALLREFMSQGKPVLGICRGAQLLNVAFGGTLWQDITTQVPGALVHRDWEIYDRNFHSIRIEEGTGLGRLYPGLRTARVNSIHHQGLKDLGKGLVVEARSEKDAIIEAMRLARPGAPYVLGVQWHPEFQDPALTRSEGLMDSTPFLDEFLNEARRVRG